jgi:hypothetical protein
MQIFTRRPVKIIICAFILILALAQLIQDQTSASLITTLGFGVAADNLGRSYVTGSTESSQASFPVSGGPDLEYNGGGDAFIARIGNPIRTVFVPAINR